MLLEALDEHLPKSFAVASGRQNSLPSKKSAGSSEQTGCYDHLEGERTNLEKEPTQKSNYFLESSAEGAQRQDLDMGKIVPGEGGAQILNFGKISRDVLLFCRVNSKEPYVFMGRLHFLAPSSLVSFYHKLERFCMAFLRVSYFFERKGATGVCAMGVVGGCTVDCPSL